MALATRHSHNMDTRVYLDACSVVSFNSRSGTGLDGPVSYMHAPLHLGPRQVLHGPTSGSLFDALNH